MALHKKNVEKEFFSEQEEGGLSPGGNY